MADSPAHAHHHRAVNGNGNGNHRRDDSSSSVAVAVAALPPLPLSSQAAAAAAAAQAQAQAPCCRALEIIQGRQLIQETQARLQQLERDHEQVIERASLLVDAERTWCHLSTSKRRNINIILLALQSERVPSCMDWDQFDAHFAQWIRQDRDVLLARLQFVPGMEDVYLGEAFAIPNRLRNDKQVMMEICKRNPHALSLASKSLKNDRDVVMSAVTAPFYFAPTVLQYASPKLRGDRRMARAVLGRDYGIRAFQYLTDELQHDAQLALLAIRKSGTEYSRHNEHLSDLPSHLRDDEDVVLQAVKRRGSNIRYVRDQSLLRDYNIVYQACCSCSSSDGAALEFVPSSSRARKRILQQGNDLMRVLTRGGGQLLQEAPTKFQTDPAYILAAVENGYADKSLGEYYTTDKTFFFQLVAASNNIVTLYRELPESVQHQEDVVLAVIQTNETINDTLMLSFTKYDFVMNNPAVILQAVRKGCLSCLARFPDTHMNDKDFVVQVCTIDGHCMEYASSDLKNDVDCVRATLQSNEPIDFPFMQKHFGPNIWESEDLVHQIIHLTDPNESYSTILEKAPYTVLRSRKVYLACLEQGWPTHALTYRVRTDFENDEQVVLKALEYQNKKSFTTVMYGHIGPSLLGNRAFLERAIAVDPRVLSHASANLRFDYDLMLLALGTNQNALQTNCHFQRSSNHYRGEGFDGIAELVDFASRCRARLVLGDAFVLEFLRGIALPPSTSTSSSSNSTTGSNDSYRDNGPPPSKRARRTRSGSATATATTTNKNTHPSVIDRNVCHLSLLECGPETGMALKRLIGEFADVPLGKEYKLLRKAVKTLEFWGY